MAFTIVFPSAVFPQGQQEEVEYRKFKLERGACDTAILYRQTGKGMDIGVSAIATGKGADFRKWKIMDIKLHIDDERIKPDGTDKFYVREESFWRIPAAVLFAALGTQIPVSGSGLEQGIAKAGMAIGLGLLVWQAKGDISGERAFFHLKGELAEKAFDGKSFAEIRLENEGEHWQDTVRIGIARPSFKPDNRGAYIGMDRAQLTKLMDDLGAKVKGLEEAQSSYKYGKDPEYDRLESEIEGIQTQRAIAYKVWFEKKED